MKPGICNLLQPGFLILIFTHSTKDLVLHTMKAAVATLLIACTCLIACKKKQETTCTLSPLYETVPYPVGVAIDINKLATNDQYRDLVINQFNTITPENVLKFNYIHPGKELFDWQAMDDLVNFARQHNKKVHGHTLLWHRSVPSWLNIYEGSWEELITSHITTVVKRYKNDIHSWDVVNEALNEDGTLRTSVWFDNVGPSYIEQAFRAAHMADPDALLFYNDYNLEFNPVKLDAAINLCNRLKLKGIPVDGIGMQMHISNVYPTLTDVEYAMQKITTAGYKVHFSELDISMNTFNKQTSFSTTDLEKQAAIYRSIFHLYSQLEPQYRFGITLWGVSDADSWIKSEYNRNDIPLLFDDQYKPKPAYCTIKNLFQ